MSVSVRTRLIKDKELVAIHQIIDATWMIRFKIPDDDINRTREICGQNPEMILLEIKRDDSFYREADYFYRIIEGDGRIVNQVNLTSSNHAPIGRFDVRNRKHIFDYGAKR